MKPELYAHIVARLFLIRSASEYFPNFNGPYNIVYDSTAAALVSPGPKHATSYPVMPYVATVLDAYALTNMNIQLSHVYAHPDNPWNELADDLCKFFSKESNYVPDLQLSHSTITKSLCACLDLFVATSIPFISHAVVSPTYVPSPQSIQSINPGLIANQLDADLVCRDADSVIVPLPSLWIQYNCLSLAKPHIRKAADISFVDSRVFGTFLQETRAKTSGIFLRHGVLTCIAQAGIKGKQGHRCEIWLVRRFPLLSASIPTKGFMLISLVFLFSNLTPDSFLSWCQSLESPLLLYQPMHRTLTVLPPESGGTSMRSTWLIGKTSTRPCYQGLMRMLPSQGIAYEW